MIAVVTIALGIAAILGYTIIRTWIAEGAKSAAEQLHKQALARFMAEESYIHWRISTEGKKAPFDLTDAIRRAEQALTQADPRGVDLVSHVKTDLAYFYAAAQISDKKDLALQYAKWAREQMYQITYPPAAVLIANDLYVRIRYGNRRHQLEAVREELLEYLDSYSSDKAFCEELLGYRDELDEKIRAL